MKRLVIDRVNKLWVLYESAARFSTLVSSMDLPPAAALAWLRVPFSTRSPVFLIPGTVMCIRKVGNIITVMSMKTIAPLLIRFASRS